MVERHDDVTRTDHEETGKPLPWWGNRRGSTTAPWRVHQAGQTCIAIKRAIVADKVYDEAVREETFRPLLTILRASDDEDALRIVQGVMTARLHGWLSEKVRRLFG